MKRFVAGKNEQDVRLSRFVQSVTYRMSSSLLYKSFRNKRVKVNGKKAAPDDRLKMGDVIELYINDEFFLSDSAPQKKVKHPKHSLCVVYEDENIAALYKPAHLLCHSDRTGDISLLDLFIQYLTQKGEYIPQAEAYFSPALCNRLDRGTEGIVLAAKNYNALRCLNQIIREDKLQKQYLCVTCGVPPRGRHVAWLRHDEKKNKVRVIQNQAPEYKQIITEVEVVDTHGPFSLCRIGLVTGRTHQIRAHLAFLKAPILGDIKYGNRRLNEKMNVKTQLLCAEKVSFENLEDSCPLAYLSGKSICLEHPGILDRFENLTSKKEGTKA
ncbi:RluA family pseudouridine synthase [uncultured Ruthenibacterium sp.]|uniref:RluA family pseudouridine synthase n=1 Tax=uncultured Ruthenibacterium sp. TaxID=1905347 RepID=UPI00349EF6AC